MEIQSNIREGARTPLGKCSIRVVERHIRQCLSTTRPSDSSADKPDFSPGRSRH
jgi:hypothetical protein